MPSDDTEDIDDPVLRRVAARCAERSELSQQTAQKGREMAFLPD